MKTKSAAEIMASQQKDISVSAFFTKNRHLLGFDNPAKALLIAVKETVDNALDACEEARIFPEIKIVITQLSENRYKVYVEDNGPGIVKDNVPKVFGKLLYGSKFDANRMGRGQQGIGVSATLLYAQTTTNRPAIVYSRTGTSKKAYRFEIKIDTKRNEPEYKAEEVSWDVEHGVSVEVEMEASYRAGIRSVDQYVALTAIANPHAKITYTNPKGNTVTYERLTNELPPLAKAVKPHPHGVEFGTFSNMIMETKYKEAQKFLIKSFSRVSPDIAVKACKDSGINPNENIKKVDVTKQEILHKTLQSSKLKAPQTSCIVPIGEDLVKRSMEHGVEAEFFTSVTRKPEVYRGYPFIVEVGLAYGGKLPTDELCELYRLANRVPLQYQQSDCAITRAVIETDWRHYKISQSRGALPSGPLVLLVHMASVWVPFTSESKEAIAKYPEIIKEIKLGIQGCARKLAAYLAAKRKGEAEHQRLSYIETFIPHISMSLKEILGLSQDEELQIVDNLVDTLRKSKED